MRKDIVGKIWRLVDKGSSISEDETRSLMILVRKSLELMTAAEREHFLILGLFCNWSAHTAITQSQTGLRVLARINDALMAVKNSDVDTVIETMIRSVGFKDLLQEMKEYFNVIGVGGDYPKNNVWGILLSNLIEIIKDVPLAFPPISKLRDKALKIYKEIAANAIKPGAGVVGITLTDVDYEALGAKGMGTRLCLVIRTADTTSLVIPFAKSR